MKRRLDVLYFSIFSFVVFISYYWFATLGTWKPIPHKTCHYYENYYSYVLQSEAFLKGQLNFPIEIPEFLKNNPNPYDPQYNGQIRYENLSYNSLPYCLHDTSYYKGKIFMYFGPLPAVLIYIPFKFLLGQYPSPEFVVSLFLTFTFLFSLLTLHLLISRWRFRQPFQWTTLLGIGLAWGTGTPYVVGRIAGYEVAIATGTLLLSILAWTFTKIYFKNSGKLHWLLGAGLGMLALTRPHLLISIPFFLIPLKNKLNKKHFNEIFFSLGFFCIYHGPL